MRSTAFIMMLWAASFTLSGEEAALSAEQPGTDKNVASTAYRLPWARIPGGRAIGVNYYSAFTRTLADPEDTSYREGFAGLAAFDVPFARFNAGGYWPVDWALYQQDQDAYLRLLDGVIQAAEEHGIGLIPSLFWYNGCVPDMVGETRDQWGNPDSKTSAFMREYTRAIVERYKDSPAIWAWEFGNEYNLAVDLPNAASHRPTVLPRLGTASDRGPADDLTHEMMATALRIFAETVREIDPHRPITTGHSVPRPSAWNQRETLSWARDTREQFTEILLAQAPAAYDLVSIHLYPKEGSRFSEEKVVFDEVLALASVAAESGGKQLFVGEFGAPDDVRSGGADASRREFYRLLTAIERSDAALAALWVYDFPRQDDSLNVTTDNVRTYQLKAIQAANRRLQLLAEGTHAADLKSKSWEGRLLDNAAQRDRQGEGFNPLRHIDYPGENLFDGAWVGLNFEHVFNGMAADKDLSMFTPRRDPNVLEVLSPTSAAISWPAETSSWQLDCRMAYTLTDENAVDIEFTAVPRADRFGLGYCAMMWASYMNHTRDRKIHFHGRNGEQEGWLSFGEDTKEGFETGTVRHADAAPLPYEEEAQLLNLIEHPEKTFLEPFYYGLVDGDGDMATTEDTMAYVMMFDQQAPIRFAMWNFSRNAEGEPDAHAPAWDWQYVIHDPEIGKMYGYRARMVYVPFTGADAIRTLYHTWAESLQ